MKKKKKKNLQKERKGTNEKKKMSWLHFPSITIVMSPLNFKTK